MKQKEKVKNSTTTVYFKGTESVLYYVHIVGNTTCIEAGGLRALINAEVAGCVKL